MPKRILFLIPLISVSIANGQNIIQFKISKPYCVFNFLETATTNKGTSITLKKYIAENIKDDTAFQHICRSFSNIQLDYTYKRSEFPDNRKPFRSTLDLLHVALVNANDWEGFKHSAVGILPNGEFQKLCTILAVAEKYYDRVIWNKFQGKLNDNLKGVNAFAEKTNAIFKTLKRFYNASWIDDIPFVVSIYPIPGAEGNTTATPHGNSLCVGVLTDKANYISQVSVALHEMCHVLYDEQTKEFQHQLDTYFTGSTSAYKKFAYSYFDEGLATALGNGWAYKNLNSTLNTADWYSNKYINGYAKALYPLVEQYIEKGQQIDSLFIGKAIELFAQKFPNSITEYGIVLNRVTIYADAMNAVERNDLINTIREYFQMASTNFSSPITNAKSLDLLKTNPQTQLIIIDRNNAETLKELKKIFPQIPNDLQLNPETIFNLSFLDNNHRPIIILNANGKNSLKDLLKAMNQMSNFDLQNPLQK